MTKAELDQELRRRGFKERYRTAWEVKRGEGEWLILGTPRNSGVREGKLHGTVYAPHDRDRMDFWTSRTVLLLDLAREFPTLEVEHRVVGEAWGNIPNRDFPAFAARLGVRRRSRGTPGSRFCAEIAAGMWLSGV